MPSNTQEDDTTDMEQQHQPHNISPETWPEAIAPEPLTGHLGAHFRGDGLSAGVQVMGDGRLDINVRGRRPGLSMLNPIHHPLLRAESKTIKNFRVPEPSSGSGDRFPLNLNIVIHIAGSRGDVQPFLALGRSLKKHGHRVRLATHLAFKDPVLENGLEFFNIGGDPVGLMAFMVKNPGLLPTMSTIRSGIIKRRRRDMKMIIEGCWRSCFETGDGTNLHQMFDDAADSLMRPFVADVIIANPPSLAHIHCAEKMGIPLHMMFTMPWSPTHAFPHPLADIRPQNTKPSVANFVSYIIVEMMIWEGLGDIINEFRKTRLGLDTLDAVRAPTLVQQLHIPNTYLWSPALLPKPEDWSSDIDICGFSFLPSGSEYSPPDELVSFLEAGPPPIYIGFGSIVVEDAITLTRIVFEAIQKTRQRALVSKGWGHLGGSELAVPNNIMLIGNCPHDWLFKHVSCVVHHGGAGTTAIGLALGCPTAIVPFFGDQPFWGSIVARAGAGPEPLPYREITSEKLAKVIMDALEPAIKEKAQQIAEQIQSESGAQNAVSSLHRHLDLKTLRCSLCPTRPAVWRVKHSPTTLSTFAATVLIERGLLQLRSIELYHSKQYDTCGDLRDPFSAGVEVIVGAVGHVISGIAELPREVVDALSRDESSTRSYFPFNRSIFSSRKQKNQDSSDGYIVDDPLRACPQIREMMDRKLAGRSGGESSFISMTAVRTNKIFKRFLDSIIVFPMDLTLSLSKGFHNAPKLYHDDTVEASPKVVGVQNGFKTAGIEFVRGFYYGMTGVVTQPHRAFKKSGPKGLVKGFGKGIGGAVLKPTAGIFGLAGYPLCGLHRSLQKSLRKCTEHHIVCSRIAQGLDEMHGSSTEECSQAIRQWNALHGWLEN